MGELIINNIYSSFFYARKDTLVAVSIYLIRLFLVIAKYYVFLEQLYFPQAFTRDSSVKST